MVKNLRYYLKKAKEEKWAIGQFNFSTIEQLRGILGAAVEKNSPVILGTSEGASRYLGFSEVNFNTEMRRPWRESTEKSFSKGQLRPNDGLRGSPEAIKAVVDDKINT